MHVLNRIHSSEWGRINNVSTTDTTSTNETTQTNSSVGGADMGSSPSGGTLSEAVVEGFTELLTLLVSPIEGLIERHVSGLLQLLVSTPHPETVFGTPEIRPWNALHTYYWETIIPLALLLFGLAVGVIILLESTSHLFSGFHRTHLKRRAFVGLLGVLSWWWIAAFSLQLTDELARFILPDLTSISLFQTLSVTSIGVLGLVLSLSVDLALFMLIALIYLGRQLVLYGFVLGMPLLIVCWIPGVGPFQFSSRFAQRLAGFYVPFLFMVIPVAVLFRLGAILGSSAELSLGGFGQWLTALVIPVVAVLSPFILVWQAGAIFFVADKMARHSSGPRARDRVTQMVDHGESAATGGRNAARGLSDKPAITSDGQHLLHTGNAPSRGHRVGRGLRSTASSLREQFSATTHVSTESTHVHSSHTRDSPVEETSGHDPVTITSADYERGSEVDSELDGLGGTSDPDTSGPQYGWSDASSSLDSTPDAEPDETVGARDMETGRSTAEREDVSNTDESSRETDANGGEPETDVTSEDHNE